MSTKQVNQSQQYYQAGERLFDTCNFAMLSNACLITSFITACDVITRRPHATLVAWPNII